MSHKKNNFAKMHLTSLLIVFAIVTSLLSCFSLAYADNSITGDFPVISNNYLRGVKEELNCAKLKNNYTSDLHGCDYYLYDINGKYITESNVKHLVSTGDYIVDVKQNKYTVVVTGDIDGNGKINTTDLAVFKMHFAQTINLTDAYAEAANTNPNEDTRITATDYMRIKYHIQTKYNIHDNESFIPDEFPSEDDVSNEEDNWTSGWM